MKPLLSYFACLSLVTILPAYQSTYGQDRDWVNTTGSPDPWFDADANWTPMGRPGDTSTAGFNLPATYEVWWDALAATRIPTVNRLDITDGAVTFLNRSVGGSGQHRLTVLTRGLGVRGVDSSPTLTIRGIELDLREGIAVSNGATLTVDGSHSEGASISTAGQLLVSATSGELPGNLRIINGAQVNDGASDTGWFAIAADGSALIDGVGSQMTIRHLDLFEGTLAVTGGGLLDTSLAGTGNDIIGGTLGSVAGNGAVDVEGTGSQWDAGDVRLGSGFNAEGTLRIMDGGTVNVASLETLDSSGAKLIEVDGTNSYLNAVGDIRIGGTDAVLRLADTGRAVTAGDFRVDSGALVEMSSGGRIDADNITIAEGGRFDVGVGIIGADNATSVRGTIEVSGSANIGGSVDILGSGKVVANSGARTDFQGALTHNGTSIETAAGGQTHFLGGLTGGGDFFGEGLVAIDSVYAPGNSADIITFEGDLALGFASVLQIELAGIGSGEFDQLLVNGDFDIGSLSQLDVRVIDGFELGFGQEFLFADVEGSLNGVFSGLGEGATVGNFGGQDLFITYNGFGGNAGVGLFTPVPEPGSAAVVMALGFASVLRRQRR